MSDKKYQDLENEISKLKVINKNLLQKEKNFSNFFKKVNDMFQLIELIYDSNNKVVDYYYREVNLAFEKKIEKSNKELIGKKAKDVFGFVEKHWLERYAEVHKSGLPASFNEYNEELNKHYDVIILKVDANKIVIFYTDCTAIKHKKVKTHKIKKTDSKLNSLINNREESIWSIDTNFNFLIFNDYFKSQYFKTFGIHLKVGLNALDILTPELLEFWEPKYKKALSGKKIHFEFSIKIGNEDLYYAIYLNPIRLKNEVSGVSGISVDITKQKQSEEKLKELSINKEKFYSILAHDLRSPFNSILGYSHLLTEKSTLKKDVTTIKYSKIINTTANRTLLLLDNILGWEKSQTEINNYNPKKVLLSEIIQEVVTTTNPIAQIKNISLNFIQSKNIEIYADLDMIKTIFRNLIYNAIKFTNNFGKILISTEVKNIDYVEITVSDNGIGIKEEDIKFLFNGERNFSKQGTSGFKGFGLGLMICKEFVDKHHGEIWVESVLTKGSDFKFTVPLFKSI